MFSYWTLAHQPLTEVDVALVASYRRPVYSGMLQRRTPALPLPIYVGNAGERAWQTPFVPFLPTAWLERGFPAMLSRAGTLCDAISNDAKFQTWFGMFYLFYDSTEMVLPRTSFSGGKLPGLHHHTGRFWFLSRSLFMR